MEGADFFVEDLLDLSNGGDDVMSDAFFHHSAAESSAVTSNSSLSPSFPDSHFSADLCQFPYEDTAELEWLSNFVEESFSSDELHKLQLIPNPTQFHNPTRLPTPNQHPSSSVPAKARSKRSRVAPNDWSTRVLMVTPTPSNAASTSPATSSSDHQTSNPNANATQKKPSKRRDSSNGDNGMATGGEVRRCLHCAAEKTPQWRTGPMGPKTLCNACGVRYKSGRLVPEYRPAASPTFVSTKHSNSHRKVMELRRQKDFQRQQQQQHFIHHHHHHHHQHQHQSMLMGVSNGGDDYLIHHHLGPDYRQMI